ncbi:isoleucine--tRNA ligase [Chondromyces apiculatus]|uniref:Isoleucine--tRNA ligase n=1 Tax=Chondromyces apiculatus DSM 436 TaxID=1192034 RepID=A0A017TFH2_9BACT|nr:isoleucine--tRNA ligase [Chondromyces apiculatus]EYF07672.1 Isoleucyl-tRNA synthetase [Chondromyces apiculatus DSM 436]
MSGDPSTPSAPRANALFDKVGTEINFPAEESRILAFWRQQGIFEKTLRAETRATGPSRGTFVFYEGPPTANGMPHNGHVLTRAVKDVFPRYKTMCGYDVPRKAGWDTHGLPVEVEVEKELRIHGKADIEAYGVKPFISRCIASVFRYTEAWENLTSKIGFWVDLDQAYVTYHKSYVESVWWALGELHRKGLLYQGEKVVWWWAQGGTALSSAEVGQGYKTVDDPSVYVAFPLVDVPETALAVWTTTPWTLSSNMYAAVRPEFAYVEVDAGDLLPGVRRLILAAELREPLEKKLGRPLPVARELKGFDLVGKKYRPPFDLFSARAEGFGVIHSVIGADFVTLDAGTGIVHVAPAFGEDDHAAHRAQARSNPSLPLFNAVKPDGTFIDAMGKYAGRWVKACDKELTAELKERGLLVHAETYRHEYPFCWRADEDPLIQYARPAWYIRTTALIDRAIENNQTIQWLPEHIKTGRFGDFLANNVDWALSRERFWGTPLNIWICTKDREHRHAPTSVAEIEKLNPQAFAHFHEAKRADPSLNDNLIVHKPWIDEVTFPCPTCSAEMRRVPEVIDAWFDSGAMPFAQWGFPHAPGSKELFDRAFPADFISEAIDQTRGWFYSLLMISTLVFDEETQTRLGLSRLRSYPHPYQTCVVLGHVSDREGKKESKSKGNYTPPEVILDRVRMEFAAARTSDVKGAQPKDGVALIAREDYEGLDLTGEAARVHLYRADRASDVGGAPVVMEIRPQKGMPRRIVALADADLARLGLTPKDNPLSVMPNDVPRLAPEQRVFVEDSSTPAPGADAFRWFFYAASPPWTNTRHSLTNVRGYQKEFAVKLRNVYSFFTIYANIDGFSPAEGNPDAKGTAPADLAKSAGYRLARERSLLDRWMLSELSLATREVRAHLDAYHLYEAATCLVDLVDALSNWYVRRSRSRFWAAEGVESAAGAASAAGGVSRASAEQDKRDAYFTLYEVLVAIAKLSAPFTPFQAEALYQNLVRRPWPTSQPESVHLCAYPEADEAAIDEGLAREMRAVRDLVSLGLQVRTAHKLKVRQPLARADIVLGDQALTGALQREENAWLIRDELNVKELRFLAPGEEGAEVRYVLKPNFRALGPKLGKKVQLAKQALARADAAALRTKLAVEGKVSLDLDGEAFDLGPEEIEVAVEASEGFAAAGSRVGVVVLHTALTDALRDEGLGRELLSRVQGLRKELDLGFTERVRLTIDGSDRVKRVTEAFRDTLMQEALATSVEVGPGASDGERRELNVDGEALVIVLARGA